MPLLAKKARFPETENVKTVKKVTVSGSQNSQTS